MNLSKCKRWRELLHRVIAKQQAKREQTHPLCACVCVCIYAVEKYKEFESVDTQNDYETASKKFNSIKEINRLRKETNRLLSKGMWMLLMNVL